MEKTLIKKIFQYDNFLQLEKGKKKEKKAVENKKKKRF